MRVRILIVDDQEPIRRGIRSLLGGHSDLFVCGESADGLQAVEMARQLTPDLILMDLSMPRMDGIEATRIIRRDVPKAKVIIVTQNDPDLVRRQVSEIGASGYVSKSTLFQDLLPVIFKAIGGDDAPESDRSASVGGVEVAQRNETPMPVAHFNIHGTELLAGDTRDQHRQKLARITLDSMVQFVGLLDAKGTVLEINQVALDAVGIKLSEVEGKPFWTTFWWQVSQEINEILKQSIVRASQGEFVRWDTEIYGRIGGKETIIIDASLMPVKDQQGNVVFIAAEGRDITEKKAHERELARQREELAKLDELKTQFFANISHEFRTPLTLMMGPLEDAIAAPERAVNKEYLELAHRNSLRLLKLVNTLLDFSRIEAGRIQASYEPVDLALLTAELASVFRSAIERAGMQLIIDCHTFPEMVFVDREMWEKIVLNLVSNAFKFTFTGEIEVSLHAMDSSVELKVRDTGTGVPADEIPRLFERFHRVKGARGRSYEGSGIGLALVQELVNLHGGSIRVESKVDQGTSFTVTIPLGKDHLPADRIGCARTMASTGLSGDAYLQEALRWLPERQDISDDIRTEPSHSPSKTSSAPIRNDERSSRVLLADDNADMRDYVTRLLHAKYEVTAVADGESALQSARARRPDLILSDIMMARLDGFGLLREVRADKDLKDIPVILLSARAGEESRVEGLDAGADDYLVKPFSARELLARVGTHLSMAHIRRETRKELEESEERFRAIVETTPECVKLVDSNGTLLHMNAAGLSMIGADSPESVVGKNVYDLIAPEDRQRFREFNERICQGSRGSLEFRIVGLKGIVRHMDARAAPLRHSDGSFIQLAIARDITERRLDDRAKQLLAAIVDSSDDAIISKNLGGIITSWNKAAERMFGYRAEEAIGRHITLIIPLDRRDEEADILKRIRMGERVDHFETIRIRKDGTPFDISVTISPVEDASGRVVGASKVARDISERKRADEALRKSEERYRDLSARLDSEVRARTRELEEKTSDVVRQSEQLRELSWQLLHTQDEERRHIARELHDSAGQTLAVLGMNLSVLVGAVKAKVPEIVQSAEETQELVQQLTREIRTTSYLLHPPLLDENGLPAALSWYVSGLADRSGLDIVFNISGEFGRLPREMELVVFRLVQECLTNIHRHSGSKSAAIQVTREPDRILVEVRDHGAGMLPDKLAQVQSKGSGVGIRGMRERLRQFHGEMIIDSSSSGTTIIVTIPIIAEVKSGPPSALPASQIPK